jgi:hypothetical protein
VAEDQAAEAPGEALDDALEGALSTVRELVLDDAVFIRATFGGRRRGHSIDWERVVVRPVLLRGTRQLQFTYTEGAQERAHNAHGVEARRLLDELLAAPFRRIDLHTTGEQVQVRISNRGVARLTRSAAAEASPDLSHDRERERMLPPRDAEGRPDPFLASIGVLTADGRVRADRARKLRQIDHFLRIVRDALDLEGDTAPNAPLQLLDAGCGRSELSFAVVHYLRNVRGLDCRLVGVDANAQLIAQQQERARQLGWEHVEFSSSAIVDYEPSSAAPDVVLSLHACDTATDEAIAQGMRWGARLILAVPCCHHDLQTQAPSTEGAPTELRPLWRHGILREQALDLATDALRAHLLRLGGYRADVIEFIDAEETLRNQMIRAALGAGAAPAVMVEEYRALKQLLGVTSHLQRLLERDAGRAELPGGVFDETSDG